MTKKICCLVAVLLVCLAQVVSAGCPGKEWELGLAIQITPTNSPDPKWPKWKAKLGICKQEVVVFGESVYFQTHFPSPEQLSVAFGEEVWRDIWYTIPAKQRTFFVFAKDFRQKQSAAAVSGIVNMFLLREIRQIGVGDVAYTPEKPNGTASNDAPLMLSVNSWQRMYPVGAMYCQVEVRPGGAKVKFGQRVSDSVVQWFDIRYDIPVVANWSKGQAPFNLGAAFGGYSFKNEQYPGGEKDVWTARVLVPGYKHPVYSPTSPSSSAEGENDITLSSSSWQQIYPNGALFIQADVRPEGAKVKFLQKFADRAVVFAVFREIPVDTGWTRGVAPFNLLKAFPEYNFGAEFYPIGEDTEWSARVYLW